MQTNWFNGIPVAITVSDIAGNIIEMNDASARVFEMYGGRDLIGNSLTGCHNQNSVATITSLLFESVVNVYTIQKRGVKKMIFQTPWFKDGRASGLVEFSFVLPEVIPHHIRG
ncbi:MAG: PAS domain-containing protein [Lentimicrobium sp.]|nr:PAS domain-containing protein [Lentimicrobium sp.]